MKKWVYNRQGQAKAIENENCLYDALGRFCFWIVGNNLYDKNGQHVGWTEGGVYYDAHNRVIGFTLDHTNPLPSLPGLGGIPGFPGLEGTPGMPALSGIPGRPGYNGWSSELLENYICKCS